MNKDPVDQVCSVCDGSGERWDLDVALSGGNGYLGKCPQCNGTGSDPNAELRSPVPSTQPPMP